MKQYYHVRFQVRKVQSYLFRFPKWGFIVGANSRLGELFAYDLPKLRKTFGKSGCALDFAGATAGIEFDNPQENMQSGTICSAGGHYEGLFETKRDALGFCRQAAEMITRDLPGMQFSMTLKAFADTSTYSDFAGSPFQPLDTSAFQELFYGLPDLQISSDDGFNPVNSSGRSDLIERMNNQKRKFFKYKTKDFLCRFLKSTGIQYWPTDDTSDFDTERLADLSHTRNKNQIAMIVLDGNKMGIRFKEMIDRFPEAVLVRRALEEIENFWWQSRNKVRVAMKTVLKRLENREPGYARFPVWPIFLGGDDVMLLTIPELALELVLGIMEELGKLDSVHTVSAGIAIVKDSYPLAQAHELAESCLSSAKNEAYRTGKSALDWHILYDSKTTEIEEIRRRDYMLAYQSGTQNCIDILSCRPCTSKKAGVLIEKAKGILEKVAQEEQGMNKYKALRTILRQGAPMADYQMRQLGITDSDPSLEFKSKKIGDRTVFLTPALDVIELSELYRTVG